jgi:hypothetical protein
VKQLRDAFTKEFLTIKGRVFARWRPPPPRLRFRRRGAGVASSEGVQSAFHTLRDVSSHRPPTGRPAACPRRLRARDEDARAGHQSTPPTGASPSHRSQVPSGLGGSESPSGTQVADPSHGAESADPSHRADSADPSHRADSAERTPERFVVLSLPLPISHALSLSPARALSLSLSRALSLSLVWFIRRVENLEVPGSRPARE